MPSYTVTYGDDKPSSPSRTFANPAHGILGVLGTSGSDPRERGRKRSRSEIEAASRAAYLARKENAAKIREEVIKQKELDKLEREQKSADARYAESSKALANNPEAARREVARLQTAAQDKAKKEALAARGGKAERLTKEQIAEKEKAIVARERAAAERSNSDARSRIATMDKLMSERMKPEGPSLGETLAASETAGRKALASNAYNTVFSQPADDVAPAPSPFAPVAPAAQAKLMRGMAPQQFQDSSPESRAAIEEQLMNPNGKEQMPTPHQLYTRGNAGQGPTMAGLKKFGSDVGESLRGIKDTVDAGVGTGATAIGNMFGEYTPGPGGQKMMDQAAEYLEPRVSPAIDSATRYGQQKFSDAMTAVNQPLAEGGLRFDPGMYMPPQRELGGATGGSIGASTKKRKDANPASFDDLLDKLLPAAMRDPRSMYYFPGKYY